MALCLFIFIIVGCTKPTEDGIRFGVANAPVTLDPRFATDATSERINRLLYQRLVDFDDQQMPVPSLAGWEKISPTHYRFVLRDPDVRFHNGNPLTAADVKATYEFILEEKNASPHRSVLSLISSIQTPDDSTIDFLLDKPDTLFPAYLVIGIVPHTLAGENRSLSRMPVGSGAFSFHSWPDQGHLTIKRNRDGQLFEFVHVPDATVRVLKLLNGELHMLQNDLSPELIRYLQHQDKLTVVQGRGANFNYLGFNLEDKTTGKLAIRQAVAHAIDRESIIKYLFAGAARPANAILPPDHWAGNPALMAYEFRPDKSLELLEKAGYGRENPVEITYKTSTDPFRVRLATVMQQQLADVGIRVQLRTYDWGTFYGDIKAGNFQMYSLSWIGVKTPDIFKYVFHSESIPPHGANRGRFVSDTVDRLIEMAQTVSGQKAQSRIYREVQQNIHEKLPYVPLWYEDHTFAADNSISGYRLNLYGNYDGLRDVVIAQ